MSKDPKNLNPIDTFKSIMLSIPDLIKGPYHQ